MSKVLIAIDPGASGGIAAYRPGAPFGPAQVNAIKMMETPQELLTFLRQYQGIPVFALMENVGQHRQGNSAASSVKFSRHVGHLEMALIAAEIPHAVVTPNTWMNAVAPGRPTGNDATTIRKRKNYIKDLMQRRYPSLRVTNATADALGILTYLIQQKEKYE